jgi:DNA polymerase (family 10)
MGIQEQHQLTTLKKNAEIAKILREIGFLLEIKDDAINVKFKSRAYRQASAVISNIPFNLEEMYRKDGIKALLKLPAIGEAIAAKIEEYIATGRIAYLEELQSQYPIKVEDFYGIEGISPRTIKVLYNKLNIKNIADLEKEISEGNLRSIAGFNHKTEESIKKKLRLYKNSKGSYLLGDVFPLVKQIELNLSKVEGVMQAMVAGSFRRMKETIGDVNYVVASDNTKKVIGYFVDMPEVAEVIRTGSNKALVQLNNGMEADILVVPPEGFGAALQFFTGSMNHNVAISRIALAKGLHVDEHGVFNDKKRLGGRTEEEVYRMIGMDWIPAELREDKGEVELAMEEIKKLPKLVGYNELKGDLQVHSNSTDGTTSIEDMALAAKENFGLQYIAITDHTKSLRLTNGLDEIKLMDQVNEISTINDKPRLNENTGRTGIVKNDKSPKSNKNLSRNFRVLSGAEVNILKDGSLDIKDNVLDKLDFVGAAIHSNFSEPEEIQTKRLIEAAKNPNIDVLFHPTGRRINKREGYPIDIEKIIEIAIDTGTILEVDAHYDRLDLKDEFIKIAVQKNAKLIIDSDAHHPMHFAFLIFGIGQARRGWAEKSNILNTMSVETLLKNLK